MNPDLPYPEQAIETRDVLARRLEPVGNPLLQASILEAADDLVSLVFAAYRLDYQPPKGETNGRRSQ